VVSQLNQTTHKHQEEDQLVNVTLQKLRKTYSKSQVMLTLQLIQHQLSSQLYHKDQSLLQLMLLEVLGNYTVEVS
jgi:hypothetical protein